MKNVLEYLENTAKKLPQKIAVIEENLTCTYSELLENSQKVGSYLVNETEINKPIPILMEKSINCLYSFFGVLYSGGFYVLLNPGLPAKRLEKILQVLDSKLLITDKNNIELANQLATKEKILDIDEIKNTKINEEKLLEIRSRLLDLDPLYANFTSGSTGVPKGVLISHRSTIDFIDIFTDKFNINNSDIIANQAPFDFDVSVKDIYSCIKTGATLLIVPKKFFSMPAKLLDYIDENKATTLIWAVSALCLITTFHGLEYKTPKNINKVIFSGEVMPLKHLKEWIKYLPDANYVNVYGPTEITCNCTYHIIDKSLPYEKQIPIGSNFDNERVFLLDENNTLVKEKNKIGEICVKGTALALGYYNELNKTKEKFVQNPLNDKYIDLIYKTGDMAYMGDDDLLYFAGRKDFQIKHMGHRIELEEIETTINDMDGVDRVCCIYLEEKKKLCTFYVGSVPKNVLHNNLKEELPVFMIPNILKQIDELPITKNGKIDRKALRNTLIK